MRDLFLDLRRNATRAYIYDCLLDCLAGSDLPHRSVPVDGFPQAASAMCSALVSLAIDKGATGVAESLIAAGVPNRHHHDLPDVLSTIDRLQVSERVRGDMRSIYTILAEAEAQVHGCAVEKTHFHEVGDPASICNALAICLAVETLDPASIIATPVQVGSGTVECSHGLLDIPAPATAAILGTGVPIFMERLEGELCTPTSAAVIKHFVSEFRGL